MQNNFVGTKVLDVQKCAETNLSNRRQTTVKEACLITGTGANGSVKFIDNVSQIALDDIHVDIELKHLL